MIGDLGETQEIGLLGYLAELTSRGDLKGLLELTVGKLPALLDVRRCSIYLTPEFVTDYSGVLVDSNLNQISEKDFKNIEETEFIVLAQTNEAKKRLYIGKIFYPSGMDITGWVFQTGQTLMCRNSRDLKELAKIDPSLRPSARYFKLDPEGESLSEPIPILFVPLKAGFRTIGVLKLHKPNDRREFSSKDKKFATIVSQVIAGTAQKIQIMSHQEKQIYELSELGAEKNPDEVIKRVTKQVSELLDCPKVEFYRKTPDGEYMELEFMNGEKITAPKDARYRKTEGFIGWIYRTGAPICIDDLRDFVGESYFDDSMLSKISDTSEINEKDRTFIPLNTEFITSMKRKVPFMGTPVIGFDGSVKGVLCAHFLTTRYVRRQKPFDLIELKRLKTFASAISLALQFDLSRRRGQLLLHLNQVEDLLQLFEIVVGDLPTLIPSTDCFIYVKEKTGASPTIQLKASNRGLVDVAYEIGQGKTGFVVLAGKTLIIDHFGAGKINERKIEVRMKTLSSQYPQDLLGSLNDEENNCVGIIRLRDGSQANPGIQQLFRELCDKQITQLNGMPSIRMDKYVSTESRPSFSFVGVPISSDENELAGVITVGRPVDENPFSFEDIEFIESIAKTLGHVSSMLDSQNHREELFINLAHEINTYLTPLLADAENIALESASGSELGNMGSHLLGQAKRLQTMTETILAVFSQGKPAMGIMEYHSIYRPVMDAIVMFRDEAKIRGCDILDPIAIGSPRFPDIEMNLFELTLAFKNIIHNAIKYSYSPSLDLDQSRFIKIKGEWFDKEKQSYCIDIQNYGIGISAEEINNRTIFKPFQRGIYSTERNRTGSGIGLAFVERVVVRHHGMILVESIPQSGSGYLTTFRVVLPVTQP